MSVEATSEPQSFRARFWTWFGGEDSAGFILRMLTPALFVFTIGILFPLLYGIYVSFFTYRTATDTAFVAFNNYTFLFGQEAFWASYWNTLFFTVTTVTLELFLGLGIALILNKEFKGRGVVRAAILVPWAVPTIVNARIWEYAFGATVRNPINDIGVELGLVDPESPLVFTAGKEVAVNFLEIMMVVFFLIFLVASLYNVLLNLTDPRYNFSEMSRNEIIMYVGLAITFLMGIVLPAVSGSIYTTGALSFSATNMPRDWVAVIVVDVWKTTPFMALLILAGLQVIPKDLMNAAEVDGANAWQKFRNVTLPLLIPSLGIALLFRLIDAFRVYDIFAIFSSNKIESITVYAVKKHQAQKFGQSAAIAIFEFLNIIVMTVIVLRLTRRRTDV